MTLTWLGSDGIHGFWQGLGLDPDEPDCDINKIENPKNGDMYMGFDPDDSDDPKLFVYQDGKWRGKSS